MKSPKDDNDPDLISMIGCKEGERWRPIRKYPGYFVSSLGRVWTCGRTVHRSNGTFQTFKPRFLKQGEAGAYRNVVLCRDNEKPKSRDVHVLVAEAFLLTKPSPHHEVNHKDGNKRNNHASNLEWKTRSGNMIHAYAVGLMGPAGIALLRGEQHPNSKLNESIVKAIRKRAGKTTNVEEARRYGVSSVIVAKIRRKEVWRHVKD